MNSFLIYSFLFSAISIINYRLLLKKVKIFRFNRFYLLATLLLSILLPLVEIESEFALQSPIFDQSIIENNPTIALSNSHLSGESVTIITDKSNNWVNGIFILYLLVTAIFLIRYLRNLLSIYFLISTSKKETNRMTIVLSDKTILYSFFNYLFVNEASYKDSGIADLILKHEQIHSKQLHTLDILLVEFIKCFYWFNPFIWLFKNDISENHEYLADADTIESGIDFQTYSQALINQTKIASTNSLSCGFSFVQTKNRLNMIRKVKSTALIIGIRVAFSVGLISSVFVLNSFKTKTNQFTTIILNAGHGGEDSGVEVEGVLEKDITLRLVKAIQETAKNNPSIKIEVIRENDEFIELADRLNLINELKGDYLLDLHVSQSVEHINGIELIYSNKNQNSSSSSILATALAMNFVKDSENSIDLKVANFKLLKESNHPAVTIQIGYMTNQEDRLKLQTEEYINQLALKITNGIIKAREMMEESN
tara:strand:+ start:982 stop:2427 length:1446 start_codon:yes stop_codon:yes gene_type:complete